MTDPRPEKPGQRNLDDALSELSGNLGLDFVSEVAKRIFYKLWYDPKDRREKLLELNRD